MGVAKHLAANCSWFTYGRWGGSYTAPRTSQGSTTAPPTRLNMESLAKDGAA